MRGPWLFSEQLRQLAVQLASLASLEDVVTHFWRRRLGSSRSNALLVALLRPRSRSRSPLPKAAPDRSRGSILLSQRGAHWAVRQELSRGPAAAGVARVSALSEPRAAADDPSASAARPGSRGRPSDAAEARRRKRD